MQLIDQHTKAIMEGCKERARDAGLRFDDESLEYVVTNRDMLELSPKIMIPTMYDYWVHDVEVLQGKGRYELYPNNPFETVINTRPAISFYNDNNPDWLNVMIFYHVLGHIDFFQNNLYYRHTWDDDFAGQALADKRAIAKLRSEKGRWVDYVIEFARSVDNMVDFHGQLSKLHRPDSDGRSKRLDYYFDVFLQDEKHVRVNDYVKEIERYNKAVKKHGDDGEDEFFKRVHRKHPEFEALFEKKNGHGPVNRRDLLQYLMDHSEFLNHEENLWMKTVLHIVRKTSLYFQPQIRTKIMNEG
ncbi:MAG: SpoVR family protein, partial [Candidatus Krumholzibacteria bacterium]|nr:SpoVR family protein [Candidatus Krumholzibacteria bacterium]